MTTAALLIALARPPPALLAASLTGWILLLALDRVVLLPAICGGGFVVAANFEAALVVNPPMALALAWLAMLLAMMPPLLAMPMAHLWLRSLKRRRFRAIALFIVGYGAMWLAAGAALMAAAIALHVVAATSDLPALAIAVLIALVWQAAPLKQLCLNRCHRQPRIGAFGLRADADALGFGMTHGLWCVGACWPLMLLPLAADMAHLPVMAAVTPILIAERLRSARPACWGFPLSSRLPLFAIYRFLAPRAAS